MKATFYVYADTEEQINNLQNVLYSFVDSMFNKGVLVTADKMSALIDKFGNNPIIQNILR